MEVQQIGIDYSSREGGPKSKQSLLNGLVRKRSKQVAFLPGNLNGPSQGVGAEDGKSDEERSVQIRPKQKECEESDEVSHHAARRKRN